MWWEHVTSIRLTEEMAGYRNESMFTHWTPEVNSYGACVDYIQLSHQLNFSRLVPFWKKGCRNCAPARESTPWTENKTNYKITTNYQSELGQNRGSSVETNLMNPLSSTILGGCRSLAIISIRAFSIFCHLAEVSTLKQLYNLNSKYQR